MDKRLVTRAKFAELSGTSRPNVTNLCKGTFSPALVNNKIDLDHPIVNSYLHEKGIIGSSKTEEVPQRNHKHPSEYLTMTISEVIDEFGTDEKFVDWLRAVKEIELIIEKRLKNSQTQGDLISREFVRNHVFSYIETANVRLLTDSPRTIAARVIEEVKAGKEKEDIETLIRDLISQQIKHVKEQVTRGLKNA